jgi:hypothetical protein
MLSFPDRSVPSGRQNSGLDPHDVWLSAPIKPLPSFQFLAHKLVRFCVYAMMKLFTILSLACITISSVFAAPADPIQSGKTFKFINAKGGTALDLSAGDHHSSTFVYLALNHWLTSLLVIGYPYHHGTNQHWTFTWIGSGWTIKSVSDGQYLGVNGPPASNVSLVAVAQPFTWHIWKDEEDPSTHRFLISITYPSSS